MDNSDFNSGFELLYKEYVKQVFRFLLTLSGGCKLSVWLCQIGKNIYYDRLKLERRHMPLAEAGATVTRPESKKPLCRARCPLATVP